MNKQKEYDYFEKHKLKCEQLKNKYLDCLLTDPKKIKITEAQNDARCKLILAEVLFNRCLMYDSGDKETKNYM